MNGEPCHCRIKCTFDRLCEPFTVWTFPYRVMDQALHENLQSEEFEAVKLERIEAFFFGHDPLPNARRYAMSSSSTRSAAAILRRSSTLPFLTPFSI